MKGWTSKSVPSPGRANKYPPPLMRFLRSNVGSRSRGRSSRASASLFTRRKRTTAIDAQQEPSSPKVTCIGQVRVRRSSSSKSNPGIKKSAQKKRKPTSSSAGNPPALCNSFHFSLCCRPPGCFRPPWRKWVPFFRCRKIWVRTNSSRKGSDPTIDRDSGEEEETEEERKWRPRESQCRVYGLDSLGNPPKNALILSRCRSAPHRSSYLASRLWESPLKTEEHENRESTAEEDTETKKKKDSDFLEIEQIPENSAPESKINKEEKGNAEICKEEKSTIVTKTANPNPVEKTGVLRRSKSEPGRRSGDPLTSSFWTERKQESSLRSSTHSVDNKFVWMKSNDPSNFLH